MNTTTRFFQTKDQYLAFRNAFASAQKDKRAHKSYADGTSQVWDSQTKKYSTIAIKIKNPGWMSSAHYLLFNLVVGKNYYNGFTPKTKKLFVESGGNADRGLNAAIQTLSTMIEYANNLLRKNEVQAPSWIKDKKQFIADQTTKWQAAVNAFLAPFGGVFTLQDLARVELPSFPGLTTEQIDQYKGKPCTYRELFGEQIVNQTPDEDNRVSPDGSSIQEITGLISKESTSTPASTTTVVAKTKGLLGRIFS